MAAAWANRLAAVALVGSYVVGPWPILALHADPLYDALNQDRTPGAVLELPPQNDVSQYIINQLCHGRPLAGGYLARTPEYSLAERATATRRLWLAQAPQPDIFTNNANQELAAFDVRYVVLHTDALGRKHTATIRQQLEGSGAVLVAQQQDVAIYRTNANTPATLLPGVGRDDPEGDAALHWRWMGNQAQLELASRVASGATLDFAMMAYAEPRPLRVLLDGAPLGTWTIPAAPGSQQLSLRLPVPAGRHTLQFESTGAAVSGGRVLSLSFTELALSRAVPVAGSANASAAPVIPAIDAPLCGP